MYWSLCILLFISVESSGAQGASVCTLSYGTRNCERLERHGAHLAVCLLEGTAADLLRGGETWSFLLITLTLYALFFREVNSFSLAFILASCTTDRGTLEPQ